MGGTVLWDIIIIIIALKPRPCVVDTQEVAGIMACPLGVSLPYKLEPFEYQVGGHFVLMRLGLPGAVCKPSGKRETYFYHTVPEPLREFIPAYHGRTQSGLYLCSPFKNI